MAKQKLSPLELFLMGKGPSAAAARRMYKDSLKNPGAKPLGGKR